MGRINRIGDKVISPQEAVRYARTWIEKLELGKKPSYAILRKKGVKELEPLLVREQIKPGPEEQEKVPHYYIVPFGFEHEIVQCGQRLARACVIVNAYTGQFEEVGTFGKPVRYLPQKEALNVVARSLGRTPPEKLRLKATLMFQPSDITHIRLYPFWKVTAANRVLYVDQLGEVHTTIKPSVPGD